MDAETWMNANKAVELGFADGVLEDEKTVAEIPAYAFSRKTVQAALMNKINAKVGAEMKPVDVTPEKAEMQDERKPEPESAEELTGRSVDELKARLETIKDFI